MENFITPNIYSTPMTGGTTDGYLDGYSTLVVTGAAKLVGLIVENALNATTYVQLHDAVAITGASIPKLSLKLAANAQTVLDLRAAKCIGFNTGLIIAASSTRNVYTGVGSALFITALYV